MTLLGMSKRLRPAPSNADLAARPPVIANSFPKSGTHLLDQLVSVIPGQVNYGEFLSSMTSSFQFRRRTPESVAGVLARSQPGEIIRAHFFCEEKIVSALRSVNAVHYFIYRDPRDVVVSEAHYLRDMNRWHRLHKVFRKTDSITDAIRLSITGLADNSERLFYPNVAERFALYAPWIETPDCLALRFEDLRGKDSLDFIARMAEFYATRTKGELSIDSLSQAMAGAVAPEKSHTFRSGKKGGWREAFTPELGRVFVDIAGPLLIQLGYESDNAWAEETS